METVTETKEVKEVVQETPKKETQSITFSAKSAKVGDDIKFFTLDGSKELEFNRYTVEVGSIDDLTKEELEAVLKGFMYAESKLQNVRINLNKLFEA